MTVWLLPLLGSLGDTPPQNVCKPTRRGRAGPCSLIARRRPCPESRPSPPEGARLSSRPLRFCQLLKPSVAAAAWRTTFPLLSPRPPAPRPTCLLSWLSVAGRGSQDKLGGQAWCWHLCPGGRGPFRLRCCGLGVAPPGACSRWPGSDRRRSWQPEQAPAAPARPAQEGCLLRPHSLVPEPQPEPWAPGIKG